MSADPFVIIGAGLAGAKAAESLRERGYAGGLVLVGAEQHRPYERPPLSKGYLSGKSERDTVFVHEPSWYDDHAVDLRLGRSATAIDRGSHAVALDDGSSLRYAKLLIATGSRPRRLPAPGGDLAGIATLRTLDDCESLRQSLAGTAASNGRVVIVGAGWIGLEVAAAARSAGAQVTIVESLELPLLRVLGPELAQSFADLHRAHGVDLRLGVSLAEITGVDGRPTGVRLADGAQIDADAVLVAVGITPNVELAEQAGLAVDDGVLVDASLRTEDPDVFAAGDVASAFHPVLGARIRVEHWANALNQPAVAAAGMLGEQESYDRLPYFFTDQYDLGMEYVGHVEPGGYDDVVIRGDLAAREYVAFWLRDGRVLAGMNVNVWDVGDDVKALIAAGPLSDKAKLADPGVPLSELVRDSA